MRYCMDDPKRVALDECSGPAHCTLDRLKPIVRMLRYAGKRNESKGSDMRSCLPTVYPTVG